MPSSHAAVPRRFAICSSSLKPDGMSDRQAAKQSRQPLPSSRFDPLTALCHHPTVGKLREANAAVPPSWPRRHALARKVFDVEVRSARLEAGRIAVLAAPERSPVVFYDWPSSSLDGRDASYDLRARWSDGCDHGVER
jgi:hypothetical protein